MCVAQSLPIVMLHSLDVMRLFTCIIMHETDSPIFLILLNHNVNANCAHVDRLNMCECDEERTCQSYKGKSFEITYVLTNHRRGMPHAVAIKHRRQWPVLQCERVRVKTRQLGDTRLTLQLYGS